MKGVDGGPKQGARPHSREGKNIEPKFETFGSTLWLSLVEINDHKIKIN